MADCTKYFNVKFSLQAPLHISSYCDMHVHEMTSADLFKDHERMPVALVDQRVILAFY